MMTDEGIQKSWRVIAYQIFQYAGGYTFRGRPVDALIRLMEDGGQRQVFLYFTLQEPPEGIQATGNNVIAWYAYDQLAAMVDMLRNEKPVYVHLLDQAEGRYLSVATAEEPVGETEG